MKPLSLIIEDDPKLTDIFTHALELADFETQSVKNGDEAIQVLASVVPAVIILDLHLPGISGDRLLNHIRQDPRLDRTQVILATADPLMAGMLDSQSDYALQKPVSFGQLRDLAKRIRTTLN